MPFKDKAQQLKYLTRWKAERRKLGYCANCTTRKALKGKSRCLRCEKKQRDYVAQRMADGYCVMCKSRKRAPMGRVGTFAKCPECLRKYRLLSELRRDCKMCFKCGRPTDGLRTRCSVCERTNKVVNKRWKALNKDYVNERQAERKRIRRLIG